MAHQVLDLNTSQTTVDGIGPGQAWRPSRYTTNEADSLRVAAWLALNTVVGAWRRDLSAGLDVERFLDTLTSDDERIAIVREVITAIPGVTGIISGPTVAQVGTTYFVEVEASTSAGNFTIATQV
jgi:hypothetical protein